MTQSELRGILSTNIKFYRKKLFYTQEKLAEKTGLSAQTINDIEGGRTWVIDKSLIKISEALNISPADLLIEYDNNKTFSSNITFSDMHRIKKQLKETFIENIDAIFIKYTDSDD